MNCRDALSAIRDYVDHELKKAHMRRLKEHFKDCQPCAVRMQAETELKVVIRSKIRSPQAPAGLVEVIAREVRNEARGSGDGAGVRQVLLTHWPLAVPAAMVLVAVAIGLSTLVTLHFSGRDSTPRTVSRLPIEVVDDHIRYLSSPEPTEFVTSSLLQAERWFADRLDIAVTLPHFDDKSLVLRGGRLCYVVDRRVALLFYSRGTQKLSLFMMNARGLNFHGMTLLELPHAECATQFYKGYRVVCWKREGLLYALVADEEEDGLVELVARAYRD